MTRLRIVSVNMHMGVPEGMALRPSNERLAAIDDLASFICELEVDVVLMQEVRNDAPGSRGGKGVDRQYERLLDAVDASGAAYGATLRSDDGEQYGIAIITRRGVRLERPEVAYLPFAGGREHRVLLFAQGVTGEARFTVANLHLDHTGHDRRGQLAEINRVLYALRMHGDVRIAGDDFDYRLVRGYAGPLIVGGDFNDAVAAVAKALSRTTLVNVVDGLHPNDPLRAETHVRAGRIDHLLLSPELKLLSQDLRAVPMRALQEGKGVTDHLAVTADVDLP